MTGVTLGHAADGSPFAEGSLALFEGATERASRPSPEFGRHQFVVLHDATQDQPDFVAPFRVGEGEFHIRHDRAVVVEIVTVHPPISVLGRAVGHASDLATAKKVNLQ